MNCNYAILSDFGQGAGNTPQNDPLTYCAVSGLESGFNHTIGGGNSLLGPDSAQCQTYMGQYCAQNWNGVCEYMSKDNSKIFPNMVASCNTTSGSCNGSGIGNLLTKGQILLRNTASEKYIVQMSRNCVKVYEPFDPTSAFSPLVSKWVPSGNSCDGSGNCDTSGTSCIPVYDVNSKTINEDVVMNKILNQPWVAIDILVNIYNHRLRSGRLVEFENTKIGTFFKNPQNLTKLSN